MGIRYEWAHAGDAVEVGPAADIADDPAPVGAPPEWALTCQGVAVYGSRAEILGWLRRATSLVEAIDG